MVPKCKLWILLLVLWTSASPGQTPVAKLVGPDPNRLTELLSDEVPVSGRVVAGVSISGVPSDGGMSLYAAADDTLNTLCIQVMSRDGRYWSENEFRSEPAGVGGTIRVNYESNHANDLLDLGSDNIAVLSFPCSDGDPTIYLPGLFGKQPGGELALQVYVNSARTDTFLRVMREESNETIKCRRFTEGRRTGYDAVCRAPLTEADLATRQLNLKIYRRKYDRSLPPESLTVRLPSDLSRLQ